MAFIKKAIRSRNTFTPSPAWEVTPVNQPSNFLKPPNHWHIVSEVKVSANTFLILSHIAAVFSFTLLNSFCIEVLSCIAVPDRFISCRKRSALSPAVPNAFCISTVFNFNPLSTPAVCSAPNPLRLSPKRKKNSSGRVLNSSEASFLVSFIWRAKASILFPATLIKRE